MEIKQQRWEETARATMVSYPAVPWGTGRISGGTSSDGGEKLAEGKRKEGD